MNAPLSGRCIVVTRPAQQAAPLAEALEALGAEVVLFPTLAVQPLADEALQGALEGLDGYQWLLFTSVNTVDRFFEERQARTAASGPLPAATRIGAIGPVTAAALERRGVTVDLLAASSQAEGLLEALGSHDLAGCRVLLPRAETAREVVPETLRQRGARVDVIPLYRTVLPDIDPGPMQDDLRQGKIDAVTFTSSRAVENFVTLVGSGAARLLADAGVVVASLGPVTDGTAQRLGLENRIVAEQATSAALAGVLVSRLTPSPR